MADDLTQDQLAEWSYFAEQEMKATSSKTRKRISYNEAKMYFKHAEKAIKDTDTNTLKAKVGDKMLSGLLSENYYILTPMNKWDENVVFNPNGDAYLKGKAFILKTRDLDFAIAQKNPNEITSEIKEKDINEKADFETNHWMKEEERDQKIRKYLELQIEEQNMMGHLTLNEERELKQLLIVLNHGKMNDLTKKGIEERMQITEKSEENINEEDKIQKTKEEQIRQNLKQSNVNLNEHAQKAVDILGEKEQIDKQITEKQSELNEFKSPKEKREFVKAKLDTLDKNDDLKDSLEILKEKEKIEEQIKFKEKEIKNTKESTNDNSKESNADEKKKGKENKEELKKKQDQNNLAEQDDWDKRAKELELQHEKELEALKNQQSRLEANFQKSIDNLMNSDGINGVLTALQEMDRSLEMMLKQGKEDSEKKEKQRQEKLELAFDSPKFKEAVGDLVKEVFNERKKSKRRTR